MKYMLLNNGEYVVILWLMMVNNNLVGGFNHVEKYEFVNGKDDNPYMKWKIIQPCLKPPASINLVTKNRCMMSYTT